MMYWDGGGWAWMAFMPLVWIVLIGLVVWVVIRLAHGSSGTGTGTGTGAREGERRESPQEILDRRFALGEIDTDTYSQAKKRLAEHQPGSR